MENRIKINLYNQHFAYLNRELFNAFFTDRMINTTKYIKKIAVRDFNIKIQNKEDSDLLVKQLKAVHYENPSDWLRENVRKDLKIKNYTYYIDELICQSDIKSIDDVHEAKLKGYRVSYTESEIKNRFPLLDTEKIFYNNLMLPQVIYYDKAKFAMTEIPIGYQIGKPHTIESYSILCPPNFNKPEEETILIRINLIHQSLMNKEYDFYKYQNMPLYANEIIDTLISSIDDKKTKQLLIKVQKNDL